MSQKILVTYATRGGSTRGAAEAIAEVLSSRGAVVDVRPMREVTDLSPYRAVVAGSAIHGGKWLPEAMQFMRAHQAELNRKPFAAFMLCITLAMKGGENYRQNVDTWMGPVRQMARPVSVGLFAGALDFSKLSFMDGLGMRIASLLGIFPRGDHRDWEAIRGWAKGLNLV